LPHLPGPRGSSLSPEVQNLYGCTRFVGNLLDSNGIFLACLYLALERAWHSLCTLGVKRGRALPLCCFCRSSGSTQLLYPRTDHVVPSPQHCVRASQLCPFPVHILFLNCTCCYAIDPILLGHFGGLSLTSLKLSATRRCLRSVFEFLPLVTLLVLSCFIGVCESPR
jgi:hypothetical protein